MNEVNVDLLIVKLQREVESSVVFATVKTALLEMAIRALEQQRAQIEGMTPILDMPIADAQMRLLPHTDTNTALQEILEATQ